MVVAGIVQLILGLIKAGKYISLISESVMIGFLNGLGVVIFLTQLNSFKRVCENSNPNKCPYINDINLLYMILMAIVTFLLVIFVPYIPKIGKHIPVSMVAIILGTILNYWWIKTKTVGDVAEVSGNFPTFHFPKLEEKFTFSLFITLLIHGIQLAIIGLIESLLTA